MNVRGTMLLFSLLFGVLSCTESIPEFTDLGSEFSAPTFDSQSKVYLITDLTSDSPEISGTCDITTASIGTRPSGQVDYDNVTTSAISSASDLNCVDGTFSLVLEEVGTYMGFTVSVAGEKALSIQTTALDGDSAEGEVIFRYLPDAPNFSVVGPAAVAEGAAAALVVSIFPLASFGASVDYQTQVGTASGSDFTSLSGSISFGENDHAVTIDIGTIDDNLYEYNEVFSFQLANPVGALISIASGGVTITSDDLAPEASVFGGSSTEGAAVPFVVSLSEVSGVNAVLNWQAYDGSAIVSSDLVGTSGVFTIPAGSLSGGLQIPTVADLDFEANETFLVSIVAANSDVVVSGLSLATGTILNDDNAPQIFIDDFSIGEGQTLSLVVSLSGVSTADAIFDLQTFDETATAGAPTDYVGLAGRFTIPAGSPTLGSTQIVAVDDAVYDPAEVFSVSIAPVTGLSASGSDLSATGSVSDNDAAPTLNIFNASVDEPGSGDVVVSLAGLPSEVAAEFSYRSIADLSGGLPAIVGADYLAIGPAVASIAVGLQAVTISSNASNDGVYDAGETYLISLSSPVGADIGAGVATISIIDDEPVPHLQILGSSASEGSEIILDVSLSPRSQFNVSFTYTTYDGTATAAGGGVDYTPASGVLTIAALEFGMQITLSTGAEDVYESDEAFSVSLANVFGATLNQGVDDRANAVILNDDTLPALYISDATFAEESTGVFTVSLDKPSDVDLAFDWQTFDGTAVAGTDYTSSSGTATILASGLTSAVSVAALPPDVLAEGSETFMVSISANPSSVGSVTVLVPSAVGTINDNDGAPNLFVTSTSVTEGSSASVVVSLDKTDPGAITISVFDIPFEADTSDYTGLPGGSEITIPAASTAVTVFMATTVDTTFEADESFIFSVSESNARTSNGMASGQVTIMNDDGAPNLVIDSLAVSEGGSEDLVISLTEVSGLDASFTLDLYDGVIASLSAVASSDYTDIVAMPITIPAGSLTAPFVVVSASTDDIDEFDETFIVSVSSLGQVTIASNQATITILDQNPDPLIFAAQDVSELESDSFDFVVSLDRASEKGVSFTVETIDGTAEEAPGTGPSDYVGVMQGYTLLSPFFAVTLSLGINDDSRNESDEVLFVSLSQNIHGSFQSGIDIGAVTIVNDDPIGAVIVHSLGDITEGQSAVFRVSLTDEVLLAGGLAFDYTVYPFTADASDVSIVSGVPAVVPQLSEFTEITLPTFDDLVAEADEVFTLSIANVNASGWVADTNSFASVTILDNDLSLSVFDAPSVIEGGTAEFVVSLTGPATTDVTIQWLTFDGTAMVSDSDYSGVTVAGVETIPSGSDQVTIQVETTQDLQLEADESFSVSLSNVVGASVVDEVGLAQIVNDEVLTIEFAGPIQTHTEGVTSLAMSLSFRESSFEVGGNHSCGVRFDGTAFCWGSNNFRRLGDGTSNLSQNVPSEVSTGDNTHGYLSVKAAGDFSCGLGRDRKAYCWGRNNFGQLGIASAATQMNLATQVSIGGGTGVYRQIDTGSTHACAIGEDGGVLCWGSNGAGQLGKGDTTQSSSPAVILNGASSGSFLQVSAGTNYTCGVDSASSLYCWGQNTFGQLADGTSTDRISPNATNLGDGPGAYKMVDTGSQHTCAVGTDNKVYCWGNQLNGRLGTGDSAIQTSPRAVSLGAGPGTYHSVRVGSAHTCGLGTDDQIYCWGLGSQGQLGNGGTANAVYPVQVSIGESMGAYSDLDAGSNRSCGLGIDNRLYCWGSDANGTLGNGTLGSTFVPGLVLAGDNPSQTWASPGGGVTGAEVLVYLSAWVPSQITVPLSVLSGGADMNSDSSLTVAAGMLSGTASVSIIGDSVVESSETFTVSLGTPTQGSLGSLAVHDITILDDDLVAPSVSLSVSDQLALEDSGPAQVVVSLSGSSASEVVFSWETLLGSADGSDFSSSTGNLVTMTSGQVSVVLNVPIVADSDDEADEEFQVRIYGASNAGILDDTGSVSIIDDDLAPPVSLAGGAQYEITISPGTTYAEFELWGAGGGSGFGTTNPNRASGGGGAGSVLIRQTGNVTIAIAGGGGGGGADTSGYSGGSGAYVRVGVTVTPGEIFTVYSGGGGQNACSGVHGNGGEPGAGTSLGANASDPAGGGAGDVDNSSAGNGSLAGGGGGDARDGDSGSAVLGGVGGEMGGGNHGSIGSFSEPGLVLLGTSTGAGDGGGGGYYVNTSVAESLLAAAGPTGTSGVPGGAAFGSFGNGANGNNCGGFGSNGQVSVTSVQIDPVATLLVPSVTEGAIIEASISLSESAKTPITFQINTSDGDATDGIDYTGLVNQTVEFVIGQQIGSFSILTADDTDAEFHETVLVSLSYSAGSVTITNPIETASILDDDNNKVLVVDGAGGSYLFDGTSTDSNICSGGSVCNTANPFVLNTDDSFMTISIVNGGVVTAEAYSGGTIGAGNGMVQLLATQDIFIDGTSHVEMNAKGYSLSSEPGAGYGSGNEDESYGGSHAGSGGASSELNFVTSSGYGDVFTPTLAGGAGGRVSGSAALAGGGVILIRSGGSLNLQGSLEAMGEDAQIVSGSSVRALGAGAGGSVLIETLTLTGNGSVNVMGGAPIEHSPTGRIGGGGSGGRVAMYFDDATISGSTASPSLGISVEAGYQSGAVTLVHAMGAAGSFYWEDRDDPNLRVLEVRGISGQRTERLTEIIYGSGDLSTFSHITVADGNLLIPSLSEVSTTYLNRAGAFGLGLSGNLSFDTGPSLSTVDYTLFYGGGTVVGQVPNQTMNIASNGRLVMQDRQLQVVNFNVDEGGFITHLPNTSATSFHRVDIFATGTISMNGTVDVTGKGRPGGLTGQGAGGNAAAGGAAGGSYGGYGGKGTDASADKTLYANLFGDLTLGAGGGRSGAGTDEALGGSGGGLIRIVSNGYFRAGANPNPTALFVANGEDGEIHSESGNIGGSGSGGGIELVSNFAEVELFNVSLVARGGHVGNDGESVFAGAGGGGRHYLRGQTSLSWPILDSRDVRDLSPRATSIVERPYSAGGGVRAERIGTSEYWVFADNFDIETLESTPIYDPALPTLNLTEFGMIRGARPQVPAGYGLGVTPWSKFLVDQNASGQSGWSSFSNGVDSALHIEGEWVGSWETSSIDLNLVYENSSAATNPIVSMSPSVSVSSSISFKHSSMVRYFDDIVIENGGRLTHWFNDETEQYALNISLSGNLIVENGGRLDVIGKGYAASKGFSVSSVSGVGVSPLDAVSAPGGGGHGGIGGEGDAYGGESYGDAFAPENIGSGAGVNDGGIFAKANITDGRGGGSIHVIADGNIDLQSGAIVIADGGAGDLVTDRIGGGAGGSIWLESSAGIYSSVVGTAVIQAEGGSSNSAGAGGGGRVALENIDYSQVTTSEIYVSAFGGADGSAGSGSGDGGDGSTFFGPAVITMSSSLASLNEGQGLTFFVHSDRNLAEDLIVNVQLSGSSAGVSGGEVYFESAAVTIASGTNLGSGKIFALDDNIYELSGSETFNIRIDSLSAGPSVASIGGVNQQPFEVTDDDPLPLAYIYDSVVVEGEGPSPVVVSLSHAFTGGDVIIDYITNLSNTGSGDLNFAGGASPSSGQLTIVSPGVTAQLYYEAVSDAEDPNEYFTTNLTDGTSGQVNVNFARAVNVNAILDVGPTRKISVLDAVAPEGEDLVITLTLESLGGGPGTAFVDVDIVYVTADPVDIGQGSDLSPEYSGFAVPFDSSGKGFASITVPVVLDNNFGEGTETFSVALSNPVAAALDRVQATMSLLETPEIAFDTSSTLVAEDVGSVMVDVVLGTTISRSVEFDIVVSGGSASLADYSLGQTRFAIPPGDLVKQVLVNVAESPYFEFTDTIKFQITPVQNAYLPPIGGLTIHTISITDNNALEIESQFESLGSNWGDYILNDSTSKQKSHLATGDVECDETSHTSDGHYSNCIHGGESKLARTSLDSCDGVQMYDSKGAFDWFCDDTAGNVTFFTYKLRDGRGLRDLVTPAGWLNMQAFIESGTSSETGASVAEPWWSNPVEGISSANCQDLSTEGTIYVHGAGTGAPNELVCNARVDGNHVSIVTSKGFFFRVDTSEATPFCEGNSPEASFCVLSAYDNNFLWIEVDIEATRARGTVDDRADKALYLNRTSFSVVRQSNFLGGEDGVYIQDGLNSWFENLSVSAVDGRSSGRSALKLQSSTRNLFRNLNLSNSETTGLALGASTEDNIFNGVVISGIQFDGIGTTSSASANTFRDISILNNQNAAVKVLGDNNSFVNLHIDRTNQDGIDLNSGTNEAENNLFVDLAITNVRFDEVDSDSTTGNNFHGLFLVSLASTPSCNGGVGNDLDGNCSDMAGGQNTHTLTDFSSEDSYVGIVEEDPLVNLATPNGSWEYTYSDLTDVNLFFFESPLRAFGLDVPSTGSAYGSCIGSACRMLDWSLKADDVGLRGRLSNNNVTESLDCAYAGFDSQGSPGREVVVNDSSGNDFLAQAKERIGDGIGDEDGLCETDESCTEIGNIGVDQDQDDWTFSKSCTNKSDSGSSVRFAKIYGHEVHWDDGFDDDIDGGFVPVSGSDGLGVSLSGAVTQYGSEVPSVSKKPRTRGRYFFEVSVNWVSLDFSERVVIGLVPRVEVNGLKQFNMFDLAVNFTDTFALRLGPSTLGAQMVGVSDGVVADQFSTAQWGGLSGDKTIDNGDRIGIAIDYTTGKFWVRGIGSSAPWWNGSSWTAFDLDTPSGNLSLDASQFPEYPNGLVPALQYQPGAVPSFHDNIEVLIHKDTAPPHASFQAGW